MPLIDFREIPKATQGRDRDTFELFARDFLKCLGFNILRDPDRGADAGRDLIVEEKRTGLVGETTVTWLVSCKHFAHSGDSVTPGDEKDIHDRVRTHDCRGFLGVYSTIQSSGLAAKLNAPHGEFQTKVYDPASIEDELLKSADGIRLLRRYFPNSFAKWQNERPARIFLEKPSLKCAYCRKSLLEPKPHGIVVIWTSSGAEKSITEELYCCCKGKCDQAMTQAVRARVGNAVNRWEDIPDLLLPLIYLRWIMVSMNHLQRGQIYSADAFENAKDLLLNLFPFVCREMTEEQKERVIALARIPSYLGGFGN